MAMFGPKPSGNPFGKISIFGLFEDLVLIAMKGVLSFKNIVKLIFQAYISHKEKRWKSNHFWTKTMG